MVETFSERRPSREVAVGDIGIGGDNPVRVQTMITTPTADIYNVAYETINLHRAGAEIVRITAQNVKEVRHLGEIRALIKSSYGDIPLVADVHHQGSPIAREVAKHVDKIRINPGLYVNKPKSGDIEDYTPRDVQDQLEEIDESLAPVIEICMERGVAMRIGVNHGSLSERIKVMYGDTAEGMVQSALEYVALCEARGFRDIVISARRVVPSR